MKIIHFVLVTAICFFGLSACSKSAKSEMDESSPQATTDVSDSDFMSEADEAGSTAQEEKSFIQENASDAVAAVEEKAQEIQDATQEVTDEAEAAVAGATTAVAEEKVAVNTAEVSKYSVEKGETLMLVAFKLYGDYRKWKDLAAMNPHLKGMRILAGTQIMYNPPAEKFVWSAKGDPYLIKLGDTLGLISKTKYGTVKKWRSIWDNNRPMIRDPNLIFAGFTLYTPADSSTLAFTE